MAAGLSPQDIEELLHELASRLRARDVKVAIRLVGGAALATRGYRQTTTFDVDAVFQPTGPVLEAAAELAAERNLPPSWLNNDAMAYVPFIDPDEWVELFHDGDVTVSTAPAKMLLAMKLKANRGRRDADPTPQTADALVAANTRLTAPLTAHLDEEERIVVPLAIRYLAPQEWNQMPGGGLANFTGDKIWLIIGLIQEQMPGAMVDAMNAHMPAPLAELWSTSGRRQFANYVERLHREQPVG